MFGLLTRFITPIHFTIQSRQRSLERCHPPGCCTELLGISGPGKRHDCLRHIRDPERNVPRVNPVGMLIAGIVNDAGMHRVLGLLPTDV